MNKIEAKCYRRQWVICEGLYRPTISLYRIYLLKGHRHEIFVAIFYNIFEKQMSKYSHHDKKIIFKMYVFFNYDGDSPLSICAK